ncbi:MAG: bacillithiol system redox-active protein YtxJ [Gemmatimonadota bacterium]|nr:bacillithiol system redox-active protein YtxJ [Gemmatimonadota bacterium]
MEPVRTTEQLDAALALPVAVLFKHSPRCGTSAWAHRQVERYEEGDGAAPVFLVDVVRCRDVSDEVARRLEIRHESPQAIVLAGGTPVWHGSHGRLSTATVDAAVRGAADGRSDGHQAGAGG